MREGTGNNVKITNNGNTYYIKSFEGTDFYRIKDIFIKTYATGTLAEKWTEEEFKRFVDQLQYGRDKIMLIATPNEMSLNPVTPESDVVIKMPYRNRNIGTQCTPRKIYGFVFASVENWTGGDTLFINEITVAPEMRGKGVFNELMQSLLEHTYENFPRVTESRISTYADENNNNMPWTVWRKIYTKASESDAVFSATAPIKTVAEKYGVNPAELKKG